MLIDGVPLQKFELNSFRSHIGYVPQEVFLFSDTIANNISFGLENEHSLDTIRQAAINAHIDHNVMEFKDGYETIMGERGITLSGGQKQRISIARALIRQPELLILDDCLSAVDTETEEVILNRLKKLEKPTTTIISSHRISSIQHADEIIFLDSGKISERGTHEDLLKLKGAYYKLYLKQLAES